MDDIRIWIDPRNQLAWWVRARWGGQAMAVGMEVDTARIPAHSAPRLIEFVPADGQGPIYWTGMGEDEREAEELSDKELERLLDEGRG